MATKDSLDDLISSFSKVSIVETDEQLVKRLSNNYTTIISRTEIRRHKSLNWGDNGIGDRWVNKKFNYTVIYNKKEKQYSENENDIIPNDCLEVFRKSNKGSGIIGIFVHSLRKNSITRPIRTDILDKIRSQSCVSCGSNSSIICDHKNDLYNDSSVLILKTQQLDDFQPLCNHCNLQKREVLKKEVEKSNLYSAKNLAKYKLFPFEFPWEKKLFDKRDKNTKKDTYWYDPVEFNRKIYIYTTLLAVLKEVKRKTKLVH